MLETDRSHLPTKSRYIYMYICLPDTISILSMSLPACFARDRMLCDHPSIQLSSLIREVTGNTRMLLLHDSIGSLFFMAAFILRLCALSKDFLGLPKFSNGHLSLLFTVAIWSFLQMPSCICLLKPYSSILYINFCFLLLFSARKNLLGSFASKAKRCPFSVFVHSASRLGSLVENIYLITVIGYLCLMRLPFPPWGWQDSLELTSRRNSRRQELNHIRVCIIWYRGHFFTGGDKFTHRIRNIQNATSQRLNGSNQRNTIQHSARKDPPFRTGVVAMF